MLGKGEIDPLGARRGDRNLSDPSARVRLGKKRLTVQPFYESIHDDYGRDFCCLDGGGRSVLYEGRDLKRESFTRQKMRSTTRMIFDCPHNAYVRMQMIPEKVGVQVLRPSLFFMKGDAHCAITTPTKRDPGAR